ncbi:FecR/PupR family sigma factor regulator, partial [Metapseudomonas otitidis]|uniref:FecR/PupR family sigma factor regulator n=1 Tax=Metapseudomonas otitidis TaxID=319939 RepID=UPI0030B9929B
MNGVPERQPSYNEKRETDVISQHLREQQIREEAADWAVRLSQGDPDPATAEALARWCQADPRHPRSEARRGGKECSQPCPCLRLGLYFTPHHPSPTAPPSLLPYM